MMGAKWVWLMITAILYMQRSQWVCDGCWEQEKVALLQLKAFLWQQAKTECLQYKFPSNDCQIHLGDWAEDEDCCRWDRVECDATTGRVTILSLNYTIFFLPRGGRRYLNMSLFLPLEELKKLDLSGNGVTGFVPNGGSDKLRDLHNLQVLDLSNNSFNDTILSSFGAGFSSLKSLSLAWNNLGASANITGLCSLTHLQELDLSINSIEGSLPWCFSNMTSLERLDLSYNRFWGLDKLRGLHNLQVLDLSDNYFNDTILLSFGAGFSSLKSLSLAWNNLGASANITGLCSLTHLQKLYLQYNFIEGSLPWCFSNMTSLERLDISFNRFWGFDKLKNLHNLQVLELRYNDLNDAILSSFIGGFSSLKSLNLEGNNLGTSSNITSLDKLRGLHNLQVLDLSSNYFKDSNLSSFGAGFSSLKSLGLARNSFSTSINITSLCGLTHLQQLDLSDNFIKGGLPWCFSNMTSLEDLDLSSNQFSGDISSSPLGVLTSIRYLDLSKNFFRVPSSLKSFFNLSKLKYVNLGNNIIYQETKLLPSFALPRFQLQTLSLSCCGDAGFIPEFLHHQNHLQYASLSSIDLKGQFPTWLLENNTNLRVLDLSNNSLSGSFQFFHFSHLNMSAYYFSLDISSNSLTGHIPEQFGEHFPQMNSLNMSNNLFEGNIPSSFGYMKLLTSLDLSNNRLSGVIPEHLTRNCYYLEVVRLSNNNLQGQINFDLTRLWELLLDGNHFTGVESIQTELSDSLTRLDISNNRLSGRIPTWIGNMSRLEQLIMANNSLEGPIPGELCKLVDLKILDLSSNNLSGTLLSCLSPSKIIHLHLSKNRLKGSLTDKFCNSSMLVTLDLSNNQFTGSIPKCINKFPQLSYLFLNNNGLQGRISKRLCQLDKLSLVDLSHNNFFGPIPLCLNITTLSELSGYYEDYYAPAPTTAVAGAPTTVFAGAPISFSIEGPIEFTTKSISYSYKGRTLTFMSGIDLSSNNLSGEIPQELGSLNKLQALNLSHNSLTGQIPTTFSNLKEIESLDLSNNCLSGSIPTQIIELHFLEFFSVSYNNLSGRTPQRVAQFATFDESSYKGNPFLCGEPLQRNCSGTVKPRNPMADTSEDDDFSVMDMFYTSFVISYVIALLAIVTILWINPYWKQAWFYYVDMVISSCYYFVLDHLPKHLF